MVPSVPSSRLQPPKRGPGAPGKGTIAKLASLSRGTALSQRPSAPRVKGRQGEGTRAGLPPHCRTGAPPLTMGGPDPPTDHLASRHAALARAVTVQGSLPGRIPSKGPRIDLSMAFGAPGEPPAAEEGVPVQVLDKTADAVVATEAGRRRGQPRKLGWRRVSLLLTSAAGACLLALAYARMADGGADSSSTEARHSGELASTKDRVAGAGVGQRGSGSADTSQRAKPLSMAAIEAVVSRYKGEVRRGCWEPIVTRVPVAAVHVPVRVEVTIEIAADGRVRHATSGNDPTGFTELCRCVEKRVSTWRFPPSSGPTMTLIPFLFGP